MPKPIKSSDRIKNGSNDGNTTSHHIDSPVLEASNEACGLRQENQISRVEAERLASFTNSSNPLFIFGAVAVGFFQNASLGILLASAHYLGKSLCAVFKKNPPATPQKKKGGFKNLENAGSRSASTLEI